MLPDRARSRAFFPVAFDDFDTRLVIVMDVASGETVLSYESRNGRVRVCARWRLLRTVGAQNGRPISRRAQLRPEEPFVGSDTRRTRTERRLGVGPPRARFGCRGCRQGSGSRTPPESTERPDADLGGRECGVTEGGKVWRQLANDFANESVANTTTLAISGRHETTRRVLSSLLTSTQRHLTTRDGRLGSPSQGGGTGSNPVRAAKEIPGQRTPRSASSGCRTVLPGRVRPYAEYVRRFHPQGGCQATISRNQKAELTAAPIDGSMSAIPEPAGRLEHTASIDHWVVSLRWPRRNIRCRSATTDASRLLVARRVGAAPVPHRPAAPTAECGRISPLEIWVSTFPESGTGHAQKRD